MTRRFVLMVFTVAVACFACSALSSAARFNRVLDIGDKAPAWNDLVGTDNKSHSLSDFKDAQAVVVIFTCNHCPVAKAYEPRFVEFTEQYKDKGVAVVAINCNTLPSDRLDKMKERAESSGFNFDYLYDPSQETGRAYGATVTPHIFVLDQDHRVAYMGAFDDNMIVSKVDDQFVKNAVDAILAGEKPEVAETKQQGCSIKYN